MKNDHTAATPMSTMIRVLVASFFLFISICPVQAQWVQTNGPNTGNVHAFTLAGPHLLAGTDGGVYRSTDNGLTWTASSAGMKFPVVNSLLGTPYIDTSWTVQVIAALASNGVLVFAGSWLGGVFRSTDNGVHWTAVNNGLMRTDNIPASIGVIAFAGNYVFAGTSSVDRLSASLYRSDDNGAHWTPVQTGLPWPIVVNSIVVVDTNIFIGSSSRGVYRSNLDGTQWVEVNTGITNKYIVSLTASGMNLYASAEQGMFLSSNRGASWTKLASTNIYSTSIIASASILFASTSYNGIFRSTDNGATWTASNTGLADTSMNTLFVSGSTLIAGARKGIFRSTDNGGHWTGNNTGLCNAHVVALVASGAELYAATTDDIYRSTSNGENWIKVFNGNQYTTLYDLAVSGSSIFAGTNTGVYRSMDNGATWTETNTGLKLKAETAEEWDMSAELLGVSGSTIFAGLTDYFHYSGSLYRSTDNGASWARTGTDLIKYQGFSLADFGTDLYYVGQFLFKSADNGVTWTKAPTSSESYVSKLLAVSPPFLYVGTFSDGVYRIYKDGINLADFRTGLPQYCGVDAIAATESYIVTSLGADIAVTTNTSTKWFNAGSTNSPVTKLVISGGYVYAATAQSGVWKRPLSELLTSMKGSANHVPEKITLAQNYPNPFNPSTTIAFSLPSRSFVTLKVFDVMGRDVATLASEEMAAGNYSRQWNASAFPSGVYFYRIQAGGFVQTKKLLLVR
jgi:hypothetical protein